MSAMIDNLTPYIKMTPPVMKVAPPKMKMTHRSYCHLRFILLYQIRELDFQHVHALREAGRDALVNGAVHLLAAAHGGGVPLCSFLPKGLVGGVFHGGIPPCFRPRRGFDSPWKGSYWGDSENLLKRRFHSFQNHLCERWRAVQRALSASRFRLFSESSLTSTSAALTLSSGARPKSRLNSSVRSSRWRSIR